MTSKTVAQLLADLGVERSHARPQVSNDNPYWEAQFKTIKYRPNYSDRFGSIEDARQWVRGFFRWYNSEHYHSGLGLLRPEMVHYGEAERVRTRRQRVLDEAYTRHPEHFVGSRPTPLALPSAVWTNAPKPEQEQETIEQQTVDVVEAVGPVRRPQRSEGLSTSPRPVTLAQRAAEDLELVYQRG